MPTQSGSRQTTQGTGDEWGLFLPDIATLLGFGALFFAAALAVTHRRIA